VAHHIKFRVFFIFLSLERKNIIGTSVNKKHTKGKSRTFISLFKVCFILLMNAFVVCSSSLNFFISKLTISTWWLLSEFSISLKINLLLDLYSTFFYVNCEVFYQR